MHNHRGAKSIGCWRIAFINLISNRPVTRPQQISLSFCAGHRNVRLIQELLWMLKVEGRRQGSNIPSRSYRKTVRFPYSTETIRQIYCTRQILVETQLCRKRRMVVDIAEQSTGMAAFAVSYPKGLLFLKRSLFFFKNERGWRHHTSLAHHRSSHPIAAPKGPLINLL